MFNKDFFPTPEDVIQLMLNGENIQGKTILEPSAGKGNIVDYCTDLGANVIACESNEDLIKIIQTKCKLVERDFLDLTSDKISHIDFIIMNPPFSADEQHILHAYDIAPAGCKIIALCNAETVKNAHTQARKQLKNVIDSCGTFENLGDCFSEAERKTGVNVGLIKIQKAGTSHNTEFDGFFLEEEPETAGENGIMPYNVVRDLVNRYVSACKIYSEVLTVKKRLDNMTGSFFNGDVSVQANLSYEDYKKELQKSGWQFIFKKMNMAKYATRGLKEDINKFVEEQNKIPFTMKNIYRMIEIVIGTNGQRMDKAILEVFDRVTEHHHENRYNIKGWKTNSHFLVGKKFILPNMINPAKEYGYTSDSYRHLKNSYDGTIPDLEKALCFVLGTSYEEIKTVCMAVTNNTYGDWYNSEFFKFKGYKNGNMHFEFISEDVWAKFNQRVAKLKGYPLFEAKPQTAYQDRQTGRGKADAPKAKTQSTNEATKQTILFSIKL